MFDLVRVKDVTTVRGPWKLKVTWMDDTADTVDMTGLVHRSRHFRAFLDEVSTFKEVEPVAHGIGIAWKNGLDYSAAALKTLAEEQKPLSGKYLLAFEKTYNLNTIEMANLLDAAPRTIRSYRKMKFLPAKVAIALRAMEANNVILDAHYRPVEVKPRGRPKRKNVAA